MTEDQLAALCQDIAEEAASHENDELGFDPFGYFRRDKLPEIIRQYVEVKS